MSLIGLAALAGYAWHVNRAPAPATAQSAAAPATGAGGGSGGGAQAAPIVVETHTVQTRALADDVSA
ncbi:MAG: efflux transporter periplasmic adaptor subunit, partial [Thauera sp.]|nr:efflux transporter periplasmic adaptor subunit [Thauera sp.]